MEEILYKVDRFLGLMYINMFKVIKDSGDFIQGLKRLLSKELNSIIELIFDFGVKVCLAFIAFDVVLLFVNKELSSIPIYSKVLALLLIISYKYNLKSHISSFYKSKKRK